MTKKLLAFAAVALSTGLLLGGALYNGYPLIFSDSYPYIKSSFTLYPPVSRPIFYGYLIFLTRTVSFSTSLWPIVILQAAMVSYLIYLAIKRHLDSDALFYIFCTAFLAIGSSAPWFVGQIMPDIFTGILGLSLFVVFFRWRSLNPINRILVFMLVAVSVLTHLSHYPIAIMTLVAVYLYQRFFTALHIDAKPFLCVAVIIVGCSFLSRMVNKHFTGYSSVSSVGHAFIMGRLAEDGIIYRLLRDHCAEENYALCGEIDRLSNVSVSGYLWGDHKIIKKIGGWEGSREASWRMIFDSLKYYPGDHLRSAFNATWRQFFSFWTGQELTPFRAQRGKPAVETYLPWETPQFLGARQINGQLRSTLHPLAYRHRQIIILSLLILAGVTIYTRWSPWELKRNLILAPYTLIFLLVNAAAMGIFSGVFDRYQSRVIWLAPLAALASIREILLSILARRKNAQLQALTEGEHIDESRQ